MSNDMLTEVRFWSMVIASARRTIICSPETESRVKGWLDARDIGGIYTVRVDRHCPDDMILLVDEGAMTALRNEIMSRPIKLF